MTPIPSSSSVLIFDIGDVLFTWSAKNSTTIPPRTIKAIVSSSTWSEYERGLISQQECYERVARDFSLSTTEIKSAFDDARNSLQSNDEMISFIRELKSSSSGRLKVYAMSNIAEPDYQYLRKKQSAECWALFDKVYTSSAAGERKPNLGFYRHVLADIAADPRSIVFVDDKHENVLSARSFGMQGIVFDDQKRVMKAIKNAVQDPILRGKAFLRSNAGTLDSITNSGVTLKENFAQLLLLEATGDRSLINLVEHDGAWNFFQGQPLLTTDTYPCDLDTTALAMTVTNQPQSTINNVLDEMIQYVNRDGIVQTYFDHTRPRFDPVVCVNVLTLFYSNGRGHELPHTFKWVLDVLINRGYEDGTRYYETPECFLFFLARLSEKISGTKEDAMIRPYLRQRVKERMGAEGDALALAMRVLVCAAVGIKNDTDFRTLLTMQCEDGGWECGWMYRYGITGVKIGNRGFGTALAINAIEVMSKMKLPRPTHRPKRASIV